MRDNVYIYITVMTTTYFMLRSGNRLLISRNLRTHRGILSSSISDCNG